MQTTLLLCAMAFVYRDEKKKTNGIHIQSYPSISFALFLYCPKEEKKKKIFLITSSREIEDLGTTKILQKIKNKQIGEEEYSIAFLFY